MKGLRMIYFLVKYTGFTFLFSTILISCFADTTSQLSQQHSETDMNSSISYKGSLQYTLSQCEGHLSDIFHQFQPEPQELVINLETDLLHLIRPNLTVNNKKAQIYSTRRHLQDTLSDQLHSFQGYLGVANEEQWEGSEGELTVSESQISGNISNIMIRHKETTCTMLVNFFGEAN